jgi:hypothetical protein
MNHQFITAFLEATEAYLVGSFEDTNFCAIISVDCRLFFNLYDGIEC